MKWLRRLLALTLIGLIVAGLYVSVKGFSGYDPFRLDQAKVISGLTERAKQLFNGSLIRTIPLATSIPQVKEQQKTVLVKIGLIADSHNDSSNLQKALAQAKQLGASHILALGDYTQVGTFSELKTAQQYFDASQIPYSAIPGDHDFWDNKNKGEFATKNFSTTFGEDYHELTLSGVPIIMIDNANNDSGIDQTQWQWLTGKLNLITQQRQNCTSQSADSGQLPCKLPFFVFIHEPLSHPTTAHIMGRLNPKIDDQRKQLINLLKQAGVTEVISGDLHFFSRFSEPTTDLPMTTVGAVVNERNPQKPRFAMLTVYTDGSYDIDDIEIQQ